MTKEIEKRVNEMLEIMCLSDGTPIVPIDAIDRLWRWASSPPLLLPSITGPMRVAYSIIPTM